MLWSSPVGQFPDIERLTRSGWGRIAGQKRKAIARIDKLGHLISADAGTPCLHLLPTPPKEMDNSSISPEQAASASSGILCATTAMAAAGSALVTATLIAACLWHHPLGQQLTGPQSVAFLIIPLIASFIPVALMLLLGGKSKGHDHSSGHGSY